MVARAFHHRGGAGVAHREALAGHAVEERLTSQRTVQHGVADDDVVGRLTAELVRRTHDHAAARQALAHVVVAVAHQVQRDAMRQERAERLAGRALHLHVDRVIGQTLVAITLGDFSREHRADRAVDVAHRLDERNTLAFLQRSLGLLDELVIQCTIQTVVLHIDLVARLAFLLGRLVEDAREVQAAGLPVFDTGLCVQQVGAADQFVERADAQLRHDFAHFLGHEEEVVHHVLRFARELLAQHRILRRHAHRAGVQVALAHHDAAFDDQRGGRKAEFVSAQQRADHNVAPGLHLAVSLHADAVAQAVEHQRLLRLGQAQFPGRTGVFDRRPRRGARATVMTGDHHVVCLGLGDTCRHRTHADFRHQLDRHVRTRVHVLQIVDELRQIFNRIDIVVWRRRDQAHARHCITQLADVIRHLVAGQLTALAGLGALRHLDLDLISRRQVLGRHAKAARGYLLDFRAQRIALLQFQIALDHFAADHVRQLRALLDGNAAQFVAITALVFTAFARVRLAADTVHRHGQRGVRFRADRTQRHGAGREALDDLLGRFDFFQRNRARRVHLELEQAAQRHVALALIVDQVRVFLVRLVRIRARRMLQLGDRIRRPHVLFAADAVGVFAAGVQHVRQHRCIAKGVAVQAQRLFSHLEDADAAHVGCRALEVLVDQFARQADRFEDLRAGVRHVRRDAHLGHYLVQALADRLGEVVDGLLGRQTQTRREFGQRFHCQVRVHGFCTVAGQQCEVVHFTGRTCFNDQTRARAQALVHQVMVDGRRGQQRGNRGLLLVDRAVRNDQDVVARLDRIDSLGAQRSQARFDAFLAPRHRIADVQLVSHELAAGVVLDVADLRHVLEVQHGLAHFKAHRRVDVVQLKQVRLRPDERDERHHHVFADRVDRRVRDLREQLLEVVVERLVLRGQHGQRAVVAHRAGGLFAVGGHRGHQELDVFLGVGKRLLTVKQLGGRLGLGGHVFRLGFQLVELDAHGINPALVRLGVGQIVLEFLVVDDAALLHVDQEHLARLQPPLLDDAGLGNRQHAGFRSHHDHVVIGHVITRRTQAVTVERCADLAAVGKADGGGAVPRLHHRGMVFVEGATIVVHQRVLFPRFRNHHHHRLGQRIARHRQQFEAVVERSRIGLARIDQRPQLGQVIAQHRRRDAARTCVDPVDVALDGVDFAVVRNHAVRVRQFPCRERVGRETLVHQRKRRHRARISQILVVPADLFAKQQALVDDRARRHRGHEVFFAVLELERLDGVAGGLADHVQLPLQRVGGHDVAAAPDEDLADHRLGLLHRRRHRHGLVDRNIAPAQHNLAFQTHGALKFLLTGQARSVFLRQEDHADAVFAGRRQVDTLLGHFFTEELVGNLQQDACAVAHQRVSAYSAPVVEVVQDAQALLDDLVALLALDVGDEADAASVVFIGRVVQTLGRRRDGEGMLFHGDLPRL